MPSLLVNATGDSTSSLKIDGKAGNIGGLFWYIFRKNRTHSGSNCRPLHRINSAIAS